MDLKQIIMLAIRVSILGTVFGFGLKATAADLLYLVRRPGLLARSLLSVFVVMPVVAVALTRIFDLQPVVEIVLIALAISPVPPLLPKKSTKAGGEASYGLGLMAILAVLSIGAVPLALEILQRNSGRQLGMEPGAIAAIVLTAALAPLVAGMVFRAVLPKIADRIRKPVMAVSTVLLLLAVLGILYAALPTIWAQLEGRSVLVMVLFIAVGLGVGHLLGGPDPDHSVVLACSTASRHPAIAYTIAVTNFPNFQFGGTILLYLILSALVSALYLKWRPQTAASPAPSAVPR